MARSGDLKECTPLSTSDQLHSPALSEGLRARGPFFRGTDALSGLQRTFGASCRGSALVRVVPQIHTWSPETRSPHRTLTGGLAIFSLRLAQALS